MDNINNYLTNSEAIAKLQPQAGPKPGPGRSDTDRPTIDDMTDDEREGRSMVDSVRWKDDSIAPTLVIAPLSLYRYIKYMERQLKKFEGK